MEEMQKIAEALYKAAPDSSKKVADDFIAELDENGDGNNITLPKFLNFTRMKNYPYVSNPHFFNQLNLNRTGTLDRREAMTFFYIVLSGRPTCIGCGNLITTIFFTCVDCFNAGSGNPTFDLCSSCFCEGSYSHHPHSHFLDNFVLLQLKRRDEEQRIKEANHQEAGSSSQEIIVPPRRNNAEIMWQAALQGMMMVGTKIAQSFCTIM